MSFNTNTARAEYTASAAQVEFTYVFKTFETSDIKVYLTPNGSAPDDTADLLTETTEYTVVQNGDNGGVVTLVTPASLDDTIVLVRELAIERTVDYQQGGDLLSETLDDDQNYQTYLAQQNSQDKERFLRISETTVNFDTTLPGIADGYFQFKADGTGIELDTTVPEQVAAAEASAAAALVSEDAAAASAAQAAADVATIGTSLADAEAAADAAAASAVVAGDAETASLANASAAAASAITAGDSETAASTSETNAGNSATASAGSATSSANSATASAASATSAATSETNASSSASAAASSAADAQTSLEQVKKGFKNNIINGEFNINQYDDLDSGAITVVNNTYQTDRYKNYVNVVSATVERLLSQAVNGGYHNTLKYVATSTASGSIQCRQIIENIFKGQTKTFGLWVKSNNSGAAVFLMDGVTNTRGTAHSGGGGWEFLTVTKAISTSSTLLICNLSISGFTTGSSTGITTGDYLESTMWQLEDDSIATPFEQIPIGLDLDLCKRYYERIIGISQPISIGQAVTTGIAYVDLRYTEKRLVPTVTPSANSAISLGVADGIVEASSSISVANKGRWSSRLTVTKTTANLVAGNASIAQINGNNYIEISSEI